MKQHISDQLLVLFILHTKAVGDIALFPVHVLKWYSDVHGDVTWGAYKNEQGEFWWYQELMPRASIVPSQSDWVVYQAEDGGRLWAHHGPSNYWTFL